MPEGGDDASLDARASALLEQIQTDQKTAARAETAPETPGEPAKTEPAAEQKPETPAAEKTPEQAAEERRQRIEARKQQLAEEERARVAASRARKEERQAPPSPPEDPDVLTIRVSKKNPQSIIDAFEAANVDHGEVAKWLMSSTDPAKAAELAAKRTLSPVEQKLAELEARERAREERDRQAAEQAQVQQLVEQNHKVLASHLESVKAEAPLAAAFMQNSPGEYRRAVESICDALPAGFTAQDVIDQLEENLSALAKALQIQAATTPSTAKPTPKPAAAKANVGNRLAAERATTVDPSDDDEGGDLEERARKLKALLKAG